MLFFNQLCLSAKFSHETIAPGTPLFFSFINQTMVLFLDQDVYSSFTIKQMQTQNKYNKTLVSSNSSSELKNLVLESGNYEFSTNEQKPINFSFWLIDNSIECSKYFYLSADYSISVKISSDLLKNPICIFSQQTALIGSIVIDSNPRVFESKNPNSPFTLSNNHQSISLPFFISIPSAENEISLAFSVSRTDSSSLPCEFSKITIFPKIIQDYSQIPISCISMAAFKLDSIVKIALIFFGIILLIVLSLTVIFSLKDGACLLKDDMQFINNKKQPYSEQVSNSADNLSDDDEPIPTLSNF